MQDDLMFFSYIFICNAFIIEGRVFCQDSNSKPWVPLGFTCPVICASVLDAIDKLIMLDYKKSVKEQLGGRQNQNKKLLGYDNDYPPYPTINENSNLRFLRQSSIDDRIGSSEANFDGFHEKLKEEQEVNNNSNTNTKSEDKQKYNAYMLEEFDNSDTYAKRDNDTVINIEYLDDYKLKNLNMNESDGYNTEKNKYNIKNSKQNVENKIDLKILENIKDVKGILRRSYSNNKESSITKQYFNIKDSKELNKCWFLEKFKPKLLVGKVVRRKCGRRSNFDAKFVSVMTNVLNKYADTLFRFTDEMTEILLENIFGKNTDLRNNIFDVNKLLNYLRKSVDRHNIHSHKHVITLKSKHCLTVPMPGCFCKPGFVESSGQCVKPQDCITHENYLQYLSRIIVI